MEEEKKIEENETFLGNFIKSANESITKLKNINRLILDDDNELENLIDNLLSKKKLSEQDERLLLEISSKLINLQEKFKNNNKWEKIMKKLNEENEENRGQLRGGKNVNHQKEKIEKLEKLEKIKKVENRKKENLVNINKFNNKFNNKFK